MTVIIGQAIVYARQEVRDDLRRQDVAKIKRALENYNNEHNFYAKPPGGQPQCTKSTDIGSWFFSDSSPILAEGFTDAIPHDVREETGYWYEYCVTAADAKGALGFYLQAALEVDQDDMTGFDEDEARKYHYRVLNEAGRTLYRVCGGSETQCEMHDE